MITCAIDFETGGLVAGFNPPISVAVVPLNAQFLPDDTKTPFISPIGVDDIDRCHPDALKVNGKLKSDILLCPPRIESVKEFLAWQKTIGKFAILAQNWAFDRAFFQAWIDPTYKSMVTEDGGIRSSGLVESFFDYRARDLARVVMFAMDKAAAKGAATPFTGTSLNKICAALGVVNRAPHTAYGDACATAECYHKLLYG